MWSLKEGGNGEHLKRSASLNAEIISICDPMIHEMIIQQCPTLGMYVLANVGHEAYHAALVLAAH